MYTKYNYMYKSTIIIRVCYLHCTLTLIHVCILKIITRIRVCYLYCTLKHECILNIIIQERKFIFVKNFFE